jgi:hypothetical protein
MWGWNWLETFCKVFAAERGMLVKNPGFTSVAVGSLAVGSGARKCPKVLPQ